MQKPKNGNDRFAGIMGGGIAPRNLGTLNALQEAVARTYMRANELMAAAYLVQQDLGELEQPNASAIQRLEDHKINTRNAIQLIEGFQVAIDHLYEQDALSIKQQKQVENIAVGFAKMQDYVAGVQSDIYRVFADRKGISELGNKLLDFFGSDVSDKHLLVKSGLRLVKPLAFLAGVTLNADERMRWENLSHEGTIGEGLIPFIGKIAERQHGSEKNDLMHQLVQDVRDEAVRSDITLTDGNAKEFMNMLSLASSTRLEHGQVASITSDLPRLEG